jgi:hypothetical protein
MDYSGAARVLDYLYTRYLMRDLTYVISGCGVLVAALALWPPRGFAGLQYFDRWEKPLAFVALGYVAGLILQEAAVWVGWMRMHVGNNGKKTSPADAEAAALCTLIGLDETRNTSRIERNTYLKHFCATIGTATGVVALLLLISYLQGKPWSDSSGWWDPRLALLLCSVFATAVCTAANRRKAQVQAAMLDDLKEQSRG